jgi:outer membrane protein OmpA-like peptidoglycan-associated protein
VYFDKLNIYAPEGTNDSNIKRPNQKFQPLLAIDTQVVDMTSEEKEEIRAIVFSVLLEYDEMKKRRRLKRVNQLIKGGIAATALSGMGCVSTHDKPALLANTPPPSSKLVATPPHQAIDPATDIKNKDASARQNQPVEQNAPAASIKQKQAFKGIVHFPSGSWALAADHKERLDLLIQQLPKDAELIVVGRTDSSGNPANNVKLGKNRARSVASYLAEHGIIIKSIASKSQGGTTKSWAARRVDIVVSHASPQKLALDLPALTKNLIDKEHSQDPRAQSDQQPMQPKKDAIATVITTNFQPAEASDASSSTDSSSKSTVEWSGQAGLDLRFFAESPALAGQNSSFAAPSLYVQPEFRYDWNNGADRFTAVPFVRYDSLDNNRTHWDVREFNWLHKGDGWNLQTGVSKVFWGVAESRHLVDIVNQSDYVENINNEEKLGQPMVNLTIPTREWGNFNLMYLPYFRERTFQARNGRLRFIVPVDTDRADFNGRGNWHPDFAARWSKTLGDWDLGVSHFRGISREPRLVPSFPQGTTFPPRELPTSLIPTYDLINQTSLDLQGAVGNWLFKLEAMTRGGPFDRFAAVVAGFEYTHYGIFESSADLGLLMEYQYDGREKFSLTKTTNTLPTSFDNDLFFGSRLSLNDESNTQMLLGLIVDLHTQATVVSLEASRRLGDKWKLELESRLFKNIPSTDILGGLGKDDYVQLRLVRYF